MKRKSFLLVLVMVVMPLVFGGVCWAAQKDAEAFETTMKASLEEAKEEKKIIDYTVKKESRNLIKRSYSVNIKRKTNSIWESAKVKVNFFSYDQLRVGRWNGEFKF